MSSTSEAASDQTGASGWLGRESPMFGVRPIWVRVSDFTADPPRIVELTGDLLR